MRKEFSMQFARICSLAALFCGTLCCAARGQQPSPAGLAEANSLAAQAQDYVRVIDPNSAWALPSLYQPEQVGTHWIGAEVAPADPTLRSQLGLPDGQGVVVSWI